MKITLRLTDEQAEALLMAFHNDELAAYQISNVRDVSDEQEAEAGEEDDHLRQAMIDTRDRLSRSLEQMLGGGKESRGESKPKVDETKKPSQ